MPRTLSNLPADRHHQVHQPLIGIVDAVYLALLGFSRSGEHATEKCLPALSFEPFSATGIITASIAQGQFVDSRETRCPCRRYDNSIRAVLSTYLRSGSRCFANGVGTRIISASACDHLHDLSAHRGLPLVIEVDAVAMIFRMIDHQREEIVCYHAAFCGKSVGDTVAFTHAIRPLRL